LNGGKNNFFDQSNRFTKPKKQLAPSIEIGYADQQTHDTTSHARRREVTTHDGRTQNLHPKEVLKKAKPFCTLNKIQYV
jgi:hypothetical protein